MEKVNENNKRETVYDVIRIFSCVGIMVIHCTWVLTQGQEYNSLWWIGNIVTDIGFMGLPMFFILSGALTLNKKDENIKTFYKKRIKKIIMPFLIYSFFYIVAFEYKFDFQKIDVLGAFYKILNKEVFFHLWFVYSIVGIYLFVPFIRKMVQNLDENECKYLFIILIIVFIVKYFLPSFNIEIGINNIPFVEWILYFLMGYLLTKDCIKKYYKIFYIFGIISFGFSIIAYRWFSNIQYLHNFSPIMAFQVFAIFIFFIRNKEGLNVKREKIILSLSKYSWEAYLIHGAVRDLIYKIKFPEMTKLSYSIITSILLILISFASAFLIHNIIIKNVEKIIVIIYKKFKKISC